MKKRRYLLIFLGLFLFSVVINMTARHFLHGEQPLLHLDSDEQEYFLLSGRLLDGVYDFPTRRTIGHVLMVSLIRLFTGDNLQALLIVIGCFGSLISPLVYAVTRTAVKSEGIAITAGVMAALWPSFIYYSGTLYSEPTVLPFFLLFFLVFLRALQQEASVSVMRWIATGFLLGVCIHIRPMYLLFFPFLVLILALKFTRRRALTAMLISFLGLMMVILPWSLFISLRNNELIFLSTNGGETLAGSFNAKLAAGYFEQEKTANETYLIGPGKWTPEPDYLTKVEEVTLSPKIKDRVLTERALKWSWEHPWDVARLEVAKLVYMWTGYPYFELKNYLMGTVPICLLLLLSVLSWIFYRHQSDYPWIFWILPLFVSVVALASWGSWRFRQPGDIGLIVLASYFLYYCVANRQVEKCKM